MNAKGKSLLRLWCTPEEAQHVKQCIRGFRRTQRLLEMRHRAAAYVLEAE